MEQHDPTGDVDGDELVPMRVTFDRHADAGYVYFTAIRPGEAKHQYVCDADYINGDVILDFSEDGRLLGVELLSATRLLPPDLLERLSAADSGGTRPGEDG